MSSKKERLEAICRIIQTEVICNQEELLKRLEANGFSITQATLSRNIKQLKIARMHDGKDNYVYRLPHTTLPVTSTSSSEQPKIHPNIEFSGNLVVVKTRPGYAMGIASDIDSNAPHEILATIAGDDTILVIPREGYSREHIAQAITRFIQ
ncbi:MAG: ArgR family transcriptional regulator [Tannerellaceae bacterium]|jgi:transcriptional regulator of arginine metabolism|nr:ArgR family transcriptional regulator [Tannerellaceae bacterium]